MPASFLCKMNFLWVKILIKRTLKGFMYFILTALTFGILLYTRSEWYTWSSRDRFSGSEYFNPYQQLPSFAGFISNFHAHSNCWNGLTNGSGTNGNVLNQYASLGYDIASLSNYHNINASDQIGCYEHGWGIWKNHQIVIGASSITWLDFPFIQNENQHQFLINYIQNSNEDAIIALAHPSIRNAYSSNDYKKLEGYHLFEALNKIKKSLREWDEVLSSGYPAFILGSDDCHNFSDINDIGRCGTYVITRNAEDAAIKSALKNGRSFAVEFPENYINRTNVQSVKGPNNLVIKKDTIKVDFGRCIEECLFIGDQSDTILITNKSSSVQLAFPEEKSYVRVEFVDELGIKYYLNPIFRNETTMLSRPHNCSVSVAKTMGYRLLIIFICIMPWSILFRYEFIKIKQRRQNSAGRTFNPNPAIFGTPRVDGQRTRIRYR